MGHTIIILYMFGSLLGALTTLTVLSSRESLLAPVCAPMGGSALALIIAVLVLWSERASAPPCRLRAFVDPHETLPTGT